jgi:hypothetical protein
VGELDGQWDVRRVSGWLPPLVGVRKRIDGASGKTTVGPLAAPFDVVGRELRYRGVFRGVVDALEPDDGGWLGTTRVFGRPVGRFRMDPVTSARD